MTTYKRLLVIKLSKSLFRFPLNYAKMQLVASGIWLLKPQFNGQRHNRRKVSIYFPGQSSDCWKQTSCNTHILVGVTITAIFYRLTLVDTVNATNSMQQNSHTHSLPFCVFGNPNYCLPYVWQTAVVGLLKLDMVKFLLILSWNGHVSLVVDCWIIFCLHKFIVKYGNNRKQLSFVVVIQ